VIAACDLSAIDAAACVIYGAAAASQQV